MRRDADGRSPERCFILRDEGVLEAYRAEIAAGRSGAAFCRRLKRLGLEDLHREYVAAPLPGAPEHGGPDEAVVLLSARTDEALAAADAFVRETLALEAATRRRVFGKDAPFPAFLADWKRERGERSGEKEEGDG